MGSLYALSWAAGSNGYVFAGTGTGVLRTTDYGNTWTQSGNLLANDRIYSLSVGPRGYLYAGASGGVFVSTDVGNSWDNIGLVNRFVYSMAVSLTGQIFAGTDRWYI